MLPTETMMVATPAACACAAFGRQPTAGRISICGSFLANVCSHHIHRPERHPKLNVSKYTGESLDIQLHELSVVVRTYLRFDAANDNISSRVNAHVTCETRARLERCRLE